MKVNKTLELFYKFLEENNALMAWENNFLNGQAKGRTNRTRAEFFAKELNSEHTTLIGRLFITGAFIWKYTPEGHHYWAVLDAKWTGLLNQSINQSNN